MNRILVLLTIFTLTFMSLRGQTSVYHPFPTSNAIWSEYNNLTGTVSKTQYGIFGDTVINSLTYHKIYMHVIICMDSSMTTSNSNLVGAIREDSLKRVYYHTLNNTSHCSMNDTVLKLYDFSKQTPGDTIQFSAINFPPCYNFPFITLNNIDSILINNTYRKQYHFIEGETWIEGIGSVRHLLSIITGFPTCSCINALLCQKQNDTTYYLNPTYNYCFCDLGAGINNIEEKESVKIYPNPFSTTTTLDSKIAFSNATLTIYNSIRQQVKQIRNVSGQTITLQRENLTSGVYFIQLKQDNRIITTDKLLVTDN